MSGSAPLVRDLLAAAGVVLGLLGLWAAGRANRRVAALRSRLAVLEPVGRGRSVLDLLEGNAEELRDLRADTADALDALDRARRESADAIRHVAVVRYDAPGATAPRQSFSLALLDAAGDGVVLSGVTGADGARTYAKVVTRGHGDFALAPEEHEAVRLARGEPVDARR